MRHQLAFGVRVLDLCTLYRRHRGLSILADDVKRCLRRLPKKLSEKKVKWEVDNDIGGLIEVLLRGNFNLERSSLKVNVKAIAVGLILRAEELRDEILRESFNDVSLPPALRCAKVNDEHLGYGTRALRCFIDINPEVLRAPREALKGGLAHEIAHISRDSRLSVEEEEEDDRRYKRSKNYRHRIERETDLLVVERGLGHSLLAFFDWLHASGYRASAGGGLKRKELRQLLNK